MEAETSSPIVLSVAPTSNQALLLGGTTSNRVLRLAATTSSPTLPLGHLPCRPSKEDHHFAVPDNHPVRSPRLAAQSSRTLPSEGKSNRLLLLAIKGNPRRPLVLQSNLILPLVGRRNLKKPAPRLVERRALHLLTEDPRHLALPTTLWRA